MVPRPVTPVNEPELFDLPTPPSRRRPAPQPAVRDASDAFAVPFAQLAHPNWQVRVQAAQQLAATQDPDVAGRLATLIQSGDYRTRRAASDALGQMGAMAVTPLTDCLIHRSTDVRFAAIGALQAIGQPAVDHLIAQLRSRRRAGRRAAVDALGRLRALEAIDALIACLKDTDVELRWRAAAALGEIAAVDAARSLHKALADPEPQVRGAAATALGALALPDSARDLRKCLDDPSQEVRAAAVWALGEIGDGDSAPALLSTLQSDNELVRSAAVLALSRLGAAEAIPALSRILADSDSPLRQQAAEGLSRMGHPGALQALISGLQGGDRATCHLIAEALVTMGPRAIEPLQTVLARGGGGWAVAAARDALDRLWAQKAA